MITRYSKEEFTDDLLENGEYCIVEEPVDGCDCCGRGASVKYHHVAKTTSGEVKWFEYNG